jgi:excinuclease ABC subunit B
MSNFYLKSEYKPAGDQPNAIESLFNGIKDGENHQTLLGVTGSGKTFTMANVIAKTDKPTLVIAHNKTLAAQLASEYREFFPDAAVHYFVSYYDYYQPEAYMPISDTYIEKESQVNEDIDRLRHAATQALLTRKDVIVVASVSCIYGLGSPEEYEKVNLKIQVGEKITRAELTRKLVGMYFERTNADLAPGKFRAVGSHVEIMPAGERVIYRLDLSEGVIKNIVELDAISRAQIKKQTAVFLFPARHYVTPENVVEAAVKDIENELKSQLKKFDKEGKILEAERIKRRTRQDLTLIREFGFCNGIENYSRHFDRRQEGEPAHTLLSYFPKKKDGYPDFLTVIDESHVTVPQIGAMYAGDRARKKTLVEHGFRLPSAVDNRPLMFEEFEERVGQVIYTSATPGKYEFEHSKKPVEQIIRPTGLVDPEISIRGVVGVVNEEETKKSRISRDVRPIPPKAGYKGQVADFIDEAEVVTKRGNRTLVTVLTKKMAEDLAEFLKERGIKAKYIHSDVKTIERIEILTDFRRGEFDVLVGVNLLREGLDLPEVELVCILDADKEGFLRSETSLIQTMGRAARNIAGRVILYADAMTGSMERAISESERRRKIQLAYNKKHGITPLGIKKQIKDIMGDIQKVRNRAVTRLAEMDVAAYGGDRKKLIREKRKQMLEASKNLDFETAALLRDEIKELEKKY